MSTNSSLVKVEKSSALQRRLADTRQTLGYQSAYFRESFSDELWQAMEHRGLTQSQFALEVGVPKQFLTKVFKGGNCTCDTIVKLAYALNYRAHIHLTPIDYGCEWIHWVPEDSAQLQRPLASYSVFWADSRFTEVQSVTKEITCATVPTDS